MLRVIILTHGGAEALISRLLNLTDVEIAAVVVETPAKPRRSLLQQLTRSLKYDGYSSTLKKAASFARGRGGGSEVLNGINEQQSNLEGFVADKKIPFHRVDNYHSDSSVELIESLGADLGILYGTNIIREQVFGIPRLGSINLHQGLAPLYRGGPTVFWELFNGESEVGITVHFVVPKVDAGDIVMQERMPLKYDFGAYGLEFENFLKDYRRSLKEPSVALIAKAVEKIARGDAPRIQQDLSVGERYRLPTKSQKNQLRQRLKVRWKATSELKTQPS